MKRFYSAVTTSPVAGTGFEIHLDGRPVRTPLRQALQVPAQALADAISREWETQGEEIDVETMPFTRIAATAIDRVGGDRDAYAGQIHGYAETDLVCYRAPAPRELVLRQSKTWEPLLDWSRETFGARLAVTEGVVPLEQPRQALDCLRAAVDDCDAFELAALGVATSASGSLVIGLALVHTHIDAQSAFEASQLDEEFQSQIWGRDPEAEQRREALRSDLEAAAEFVGHLRAG